MASTWRYGKRSKYRAKVSQDSEDNYRLDPKKSAAENCFDIYTALCCRDTRDAKRLFLLNGLATLCQQQEQQSKKLISSARPTHSSGGASTSATALTTISTLVTARNCLGFSTEELLYCLSASLIHTFTQVRAAALRTIRYVLTTVKDVKVFNSLQLPHLICRSIDLMLKNDDERVQALKLIRKMLAISAENISPVLVRCLVSLADTGIEESDNLLRACLATLCEFAVLNPTLLICCGGVTSITRNVLECHNPRIAESLSGVLLYLLEWPQTRNISGVRLDCLAAPYCDFTYRLGIMDKNKDARELRYTSCRLALLSVLRSWTGTIEFCDPSKPSGLKAIVDALYLNQIEVRKAILELLYELLGLPQPIWTDDYIVALQAVDPSDFQVNWLLSNGFVAAEGRSILPSLAARTPNICEQHLALQLYCFLETGLVNALVEVIVSSETAVSVAATVLIGKILHLMHTHLPADICSTSPALPTLISHATQGNQRASAAISALQCYQKMLRNRPASSSLFLDSIIQEGSLIHTRLFRREINALPFPSGLQSPTASQVNTGVSQLQAMGGTLERPRHDSVSSSDESNSQSSSTRRSSFRLKCKLLPFLENIKVNRLIKESNVLNAKDGSGWEWEIISTIIRCNLIRKLEEPSLQFLKNLIGYFKPSHNHFSHQELVHGKSLPVYVKVGLDFIDWLLAISPFESIRLLTDFFTDVATQLLAVTTSNRAHDCLFSPQHMNNTMCQQYFLFIGRMCRSQKGISILTNTAVFEHLINLVRNTEHVCYVKLIVSGLDYTLDSITRKVLENALTSAKTRSGRLYATQFLVVLLRSRIPNFEVWGIPLIIQQTKDSDRSVVLAAMDVLEEACHEKYYLEEIVSLWPNLKPLGDIGRILMARYYSLPRGLNQPKARIKEEIEYWKNGYNKRYVLLVEADTHSSLTLHIRNEDGYYSRRNCNTRPIIIPPNIPAHLYGQMVQTTQGTTALRKFGDLTQLMDVVCRGKCSDESECLELKAAIWAIAHASTHSNGIEFFLESGSRIYDKFVFLATKCEVYSIRATCYNSLGLIGSTNAGANVLFKLNWLSVRHDRNTIWPVHQPEDWMLGNYTPVRHHYEDMPPYNYTGLEDQIDGSYYTGSYWNLLLSSTSTNRDAVGAASASSEAQDANTTTDSIKTSGEEVSGDNISQPNKLSSPRTKLEKTYSSKQVGSASIGVGGTSVSGSVSASGSGNVIPASTKSKTLPEGSYLRHGKHQRSLSESKTTDVISLLSTTGAGGILPTSSSGFYHSHRTRYNSCTDSNTSGVSSCESVTGRAAPMGELQQFPLSPIPSMSNLLEIPLGQSSLLRRTSLVGNSYLQNAISPVDIKGYAQLRSLRRHCRPVLSESAAELYDIVDRMELLSFASFRPRKSSFGDSQRKMKVRSLDRQTSLRMYAHLDTEELQVPLPSLNTPKFLSQSDLKGPCYAGISLPKNLLDMFPTRNLSRTYVSQDIQDQDLMDINLLTSKQQFLNDSLNNEAGDESSVISSLSDVSSVSKRSKWIGAKHGRSNCLHCCRLRKSVRSQNQSRLDGGASDLSSTTTLCEMYTNASAALVAAGIQATVALARKGGGNNSAGGTSGVSTNKVPLYQQQQQFSNTSSIQLSELQFHSPESILSEESLPDKLTANILYNVQRLANPVSAKQSKMALLELKQKHPTSFQDICLYSEVCRTLGRSSYRMNARRFLQELFLDLEFDSFYNEPLDIISKKEKESFKSSENKERTVGADKLSLLKERMKRDLNSSGNRLDNSLVDSRAESIQSATTGSNNVIVIGSQTMKTHLKSQPLASVYEASCENLLLDPSPRLKNSSISGKSVNSKQNCKNFTIAPPPAAPPPLQEYNTELRITSDDDDEDENDNVDEDEHSGNSSNYRSPQRQKQQLSDEVDGPTVRPSSSVNSLNPASSSNLMHPIQYTTAYSSQNNYLQSGGSVSTPISSSNCSDQTTTSNRSSICTISHHPLSNNNSNNRYNSTPLTSPSQPKSIENENTKFRRGRFYTLELDLSCTKNKFPITDRTKANINSTFVPKTVIEKTPIASTASTLISITSPNKPIRTNASLLRQHSLGSDSSSNYKLPVSRLSYTAGLTPLSTSTTLTKSISSSNDSNNPKYLITKSLAASLVQPFGTLYCEKRLQPSKSEAVLVQNPSITTVTSGSLPSTSRTCKGDSNSSSSDSTFPCSAVKKTSTISRSSSSHEGENQHKQS
ncbi:rapamycin-insensitive companion of mTOR isoform X1 [Lucilia sericata]|uniref:rapamycin-insensitive companion of mTOR isoform X1 n=1 Tax=Lucilia sericata TaxID=13632 RepID=UPI0018A81F69|nr:rapamycin-insensitive companion of mTOR isoform X1 [Lucilia sericata]XP_037816876.1 rapamycin-insensitive companion of mTOR isoform X1 [Lucilia sericata]XP_037816884.1 rapamycin-insensitive companion of mTOR isoform X1 [Lucilia sericata]XP_037816890.1 rapamycin-insensitive companion of mTOR isoform X1 [Lucilia sericata]XP_037816899.1 rapamycin-insensitive companion of mTOR isoform X1 [Lucilia sericata]XP_037816905.1 rapamycin-insensitive companion of mTOR isoform X1 [Lucilia sericata]XP_03